MDGEGGRAEVAPPGGRSLHRFARATAGATFLLLVAGANVTSTGSGLAVPDWPLAFGQWLPPMVGKVLNEHGHRLIAMGVGTMTLVLSLWILGKERRASVRWLGIAALGAVIAQGILGRYTVLLKLPPAVSIAHAALAEAFFCLTIALAYVLRPTFSPGLLPPDPTPPTSPSNHQAPTEADQANLVRIIDPTRLPVPGHTGRCIAATLTVYAQILLGAYRRHMREGLIWHLFGAVAVVLVVYWTAQRIFQDAEDRARLRTPAWWAMGLVQAQFVLGMAAATFVVRVDEFKGTEDPFHVWTRNFHLATGAALLATCFGMTLRAANAVRPAPRAVPG